MRTLTRLVCDDIHASSRSHGNPPYKGVDDGLADIILALLKLISVQSGHPPDMHASTDILLPGSDSFIPVTSCPCDYSMYSSSEKIETRSVTAKEMFMHLRQRLDYL